MERPTGRYLVWLVVLAAAIALAAAASLGAQERSDPRGDVGPSFVAGNPVGELGAFFDHGFGSQLEGSWVLTEVPQALVDRSRARRTAARSSFPFALRGSPGATR
jgi:hypothetical protein